MTPVPDLQVQTRDWTLCFVHLTRIAELLAPFLANPLSDAQLAQLAAYLEILHRWNARMNLTAVRDPEQMVTRHFGESLFAAQQLFPAARRHSPSTLVDIGSGAGFPGLPIKIWAPEVDVTLIESQAKKATFLKEVIRALELQGIAVANTRAEEVARDRTAGNEITVTLRAVERFDRILPVAGQLGAKGRLAILIGSPQVDVARKLAPSFRWADALPIPQSLARVLLIGESK